MASGGGLAEVWAAGLAGEPGEQVAGVVDLHWEVKAAVAAQAPAMARDELVESGEDGCPERFRVATRHGREDENWAITPVAGRAKRRSGD